MGEQIYETVKLKRSDLRSNGHTMKARTIRKSVFLALMLIVGILLTMNIINRRNIDLGIVDFENRDDQQQITGKIEKTTNTEAIDVHHTHFRSTLDVDDSMAEAKRRAQWEANFPWVKTYDPDIRFDTRRHFTVRTKKSGESTHRMSATDRVTGSNHYILKNFFEDELRYSSQFEKFYNILNEHGRGHNPAEAAGVFWALRRYYHTAFENSPDDRIDDVGIEAGLTVFGDSTYREASETQLDNLKGRLMGWEWMDQRFFGEAGQVELMGLIERLTTEIDDLGELPVNVMPYGGVSGMADNSAEAQGLLTGEEELLVPYVGWNEQSENYHGTQKRQFQASYEQGDPSLKAAAPELFPPVGVSNGQLVDKDGDPVKWSESMGLTLINERGERVPAIVEEDGSVSLPTPEEVEVMRQSGEVQPATVGDVAPIIQSILKANQRSQ